VRQLDNKATGGSRKVTAVSVAFFSEVLEVPAMRQIFDGRLMADRLGIETCM
jgi:hypothetical protein